MNMFFFFFSSRRRHTSLTCDWSSDVCSSDLAWVRAPFRRYVDQVGPNEMAEETRGEGAQAALGELVGCPYCLGLWVAGALAAGFVAAPRESRFVATIFSGMTVADFMQIAYKAAQDRGLGGE